MQILLPEENGRIIKITRAWIREIVIGLDLCPFAAREFHGNRLRVSVSAATSEPDLLADLANELETLDNDVRIETSLLVHPQVLQDFSRYNQFLDRAEALLTAKRKEGVYQIASFHPQYQFAETAPQDVENYTNRSPYPMLHILREASIERALRHFRGDIRDVPQRNITRLRDLGVTNIQAMLIACDQAGDL